MWWLEQSFDKISMTSWLCSTVKPVYSEHHGNRPNSIHYIEVLHWLNCRIYAAIFINDRTKFEQKIKMTTNSHYGYYTIKLCLHTNFYKYFHPVCFFLILHLHQHLMHSLDLKTVPNVVYRREISPVYSISSGPQRCVI